MEPHRAPYVLVYQHQLARQAIARHQVIVQLIASTKTETGLNITCDIDWGHYPKSIKIPKTAPKDLNIKYDDSHGDWIYTIAPISKMRKSRP